MSPLGIYIYIYFGHRIGAIQPSIWLANGKNEKFYIFLIQCLVYISQYN